MTQEYKCDGSIFVLCVYFDAGMYKKNRKKVDVRPSAISTFSHRRNEWATMHDHPALCCMTILLEKEKQIKASGVSSS